MSKRDEFLLSVLSHPTDECVPWPFALYWNGYGQTKYMGRKMAASRAMCLMAHGEPPEGKTDAAHECGNRQCVNPRHIRWATSQENQFDKIAQGRVPTLDFKGERNNHAKLTREQALEIRERAKRGDDYGDIAKEFGISRGYVSAIKLGRYWP